MMRNVRKNVLLFFIVLLVGLSICLLACTPAENNNTDNNDVSEKKVLKIEVVSDESTLEGVVGEIDVSRIRLNVIYDNGEYDIIPVEIGFISTDTRAKLQKTGKQQIKIIYQGCQTFVWLTLREKPVKMFTLTVTDGIPVEINETPVTLSSEQNPFTAQYPEGTKVTVAWVKQEGRHFERWSDNDEEQKDTESTTQVVMDTDHRLVAHSKEDSSTVSFTTNCDVGISDITSDTITASMLPSLKKDGYVFDGWTETEVVGDDAIDCNSPKITFPYTVRRSIKLFGTWRELGLDYDSYVNDLTGTGGLIIVNYHRNDKEVIIPDTSNNSPIIAISVDAFQNASALEKLFIPATVEVIDTGFLRNCSRLKEIEVDPASNYFSDDEGVLFNVAGDELIAYPAGRLNATYEPDGIKVIRDYAFYDAVVGGIVLPSSVREVGDHAFDSVHIDYVNLAALNPNEVGFSLGTDLFNDNVNTILLNSGTIGTFEAMPAFLPFADRLSDDATILSNIGINADRTLIYKNIFNENSDSNATTNEIIGADRSLTELTLPIELDNFVISSIGFSAFNGCIYLSSFSIPKMSQLERILENAFLGTPYQERRLADDGCIIFNKILYKYLGDETVYALPEDIEVIAEGAFRGNQSLQYIDLTESKKLKKIGPFAFYNCPEFLGSVTNGVFDEGIRLKKTVSAIGNYAFSYSGLRAFYLASDDSGLETIGKEAFSHCYYLTQVVLGGNTVDVSKDAFLYCYSLNAFSVRQKSNGTQNTEFVAHDGVLYAKGANSSVFDTLFAYPAGRLAAEFNVNDPAGTGADVITVTTIGDYALFYANILSLYVPASVTSISSDSVYIPGLVSVRFYVINQGLTYADMFNKIEENLGLPKKEPEYITVVDLSPENTERSINSYFGNVAALRESKYIENKETTFVFSTDEKTIFRMHDDHASVARYSRLPESATIPESISGKNVTVVDGYAYLGYYLTELELGRYISLLSDYSLSEAYSLKHLRTDDSSIPDVEENTFGDSFNNGLYIYIDIAGAQNYEDKWGADEKYLIDKTFDAPKVTFAYLLGEEAAEIDPLYGAISADQVPAPVREGYQFGGWMDANSVVIDFTDGYIPPYNVTLYCKWIPMEYTIVFNIGNVATMEETTTTVRYGVNYTFKDPVYEKRIKEIVNWCVPSDNNHVIETSGVWTYLGKTSTIVLYPVWKDVDYVLVYDDENGAVTIAGDSQKIVHYNENYSLTVPEKEGFDFVGWALDDEEETMLTGKDGKSLLPWEHNDKREYDVFAKWTVKTNIVVSLYFEEGAFYKSYNLTYGQSFSFPYETNEIGWYDKADVFCGWYDEYDSVSHSGTGTRYTDEDGNGLFDWNVGHDISLYAQWPVVVSSASQLATVLNEDMSRSIVLDDDIALDAPIGSGSNPYTGTFNGGGHTVTFTYDSASDLSFDGYVGLFAYNKGTIKNFVLNANITVDATSMANNSELYVGAVAGKNEGKISSSVGSSDVTATISVNVSVISAAHIGGLVGYNDGGSVVGVGLVLNPLSVSVNGTAYDAAPNKSFISCGLLFGTINGGSVDKKSSAFIYRKASENDPFYEVKSGTNVLSTPINVSVAYE